MHGRNITPNTTSGNQTQLIIVAIKIELIVKLQIDSLRNVFFQPNLANPFPAQNESISVSCLVHSGPFLAKTIECAFST